MNTKDNVRVYATINELAQAAAQDFFHSSQKAIADHGFFSVALSGGSTPKSLFDELAAHYSDTIEWNKVVFFWGDERYVPYADEKSNYHTARKYLLSRVPVAEKNIFPLPTNFADPSEAALSYQKSVRNFFHNNKSASIDLFYLGMGSDGHTASLFSDSPIVQQCAKGSEDTQQLITAHYVQKMNQWRLSATPSFIRAAQAIVLLISGEDKAQTLLKVLEGSYQPTSLPVQLITHLNNHCVFLLDKAAAAGLTR